MDTATPKMRLTAGSRLCDREVADPGPGGRATTSSQTNDYVRAAAKVMAEKPAGHYGYSPMAR